IDYVNENNLLEKIKSCDAVSLTDASVWNFVLRRKKRSFRREIIKSELMAMVKCIGSAEFHCKVMVPQTEGRAKIPREYGADCVQYAWAVVDDRKDASPDVDAVQYRHDVSTKAI